MRRRALLITAAGVLFISACNGGRLVVTDSDPNGGRFELQNNRWELTSQNGNATYRGSLGRLQYRGSKERFRILDQQGITKEYPLTPIVGSTPTPYVLSDAELSGQFKCTAPTPGPMDYSGKITLTDGSVDRTFHLKQPNATCSAEYTVRPEKQKKQAR